MQKNTMNYHQQIIVENVLIFIFQYMYRPDFIFSSTNYLEKGSRGERSALFLHLYLLLNHFLSLCINTVCRGDYLFLLLHSSLDTTGLPSSSLHLATRTQTHTQHQGLLLNRKLAASGLELNWPRCGHLWVKFRLLLYWDLQKRTEQTFRIKQGNTLQEILDTIYLLIYTNSRKWSLHFFL